MVKFRDFDHNHTLDPAIAVKRAFLLRVEVNPPNCLSNDEKEACIRMLDSQVPEKVEWLRFEGKELDKCRNCC